MRERRIGVADSMSDERDPRPMGDYLAELRELWGVTSVAPQAEHYDLAAAVRKQRLETFHSFCPEEFRRKIDRTKIPNLKAWDKADAWTGSFPGVWLWSKKTGEAKTRMGWRKFGQLHVERGKSVVRITGLHLAEDYHDSFQKNATARFYRELCSSDVIMLDDLDKMALPEKGQGFGERDQAVRNARMVRELFDHFYERRMCVLVTANEPINFFATRIGESAERRMHAVCEEIPF